MGAAEDGTWTPTPPITEPTPRVEPRPDATERSPEGVGRVAEGGEARYAAINAVPEPVGEGVKRPSSSSNPEARI